MEKNIDEKQNTNYQNHPLTLGERITNMEEMSDTIDHLKNLIEQSIKRKQEADNARKAS